MQINLYKSLHTYFSKIIQDGLNLKKLIYNPNLITHALHSCSFDFPLASVTLLPFVVGGWFMAALTIYVKQLFELNLTVFIPLNIKIIFCE